MITSAAPQALEELHPSLWRASQLGRSATRCIDTGHLALSHQLPGGGWPTGTLIELLVSRPGIGELRVLAPALAAVATKQIVLIEPPHTPNTIALAGLGLKPADVLWIKSKVTNDALWTAQETLRSGCFGAVLLFSTHLRPESLRRLTLAASTSETLLFVFRPIATAQDPSPAALRLSMRPASGGIELGFVKLRGPQRDHPLFLPLMVSQAHPMPRTTPTTPIPVPVRGQIPKTVNVS